MSKNVSKSEDFSDVNGKSYFHLRPDIGFLDDDYNTIMITAASKTHKQLLFSVTPSCQKSEKQHI